MPKDRPEQVQRRVLVLAPIGRDAQAAALHLAESKIESVVCDDIADLLVELSEGAALALVTEEAFLRGGMRPLDEWVADQPPWSDFPFIVLTSRATSVATQAYRQRLLESLGNVSLLERPLNAVTLTSAIHSAMRARSRQYEVQHHLLNRDTFAAQLEEQLRDGPDSSNRRTNSSASKLLSARKSRRLYNKLRKWKSSAR